jgi:hypothetical protein
MWVLIFLVLKIGVSYKLEYELPLRRHSLLEDESEYVSFSTPKFLIGSYSNDKASKSRARRPGCLEYGAQWFAGNIGMGAGALVGAIIGYVVAIPFGGTREDSPTIGKIIGGLFVVTGIPVGAGAGVTFFSRTIDLEGSFSKSIIGASIGTIPAILVAPLVPAAPFICIPTGAVIGYYWKNI